MTVPNPRQPDEDFVTGMLPFVAQSLRRLEDSVARGFADVNTQLTRMPELYVPRREVERRFDETEHDVTDLRSQLAQAKVQHDSDVKALQKAAADLEERREAEAREARKERVNGRRWLAGLTASTGVAVFGTVSSIYLNLHGG